jgi:hypothetical protein
MVWAFWNQMRLNLYGKLWAEEESLEERLRKSWSDEIPY